MRVNERRHKRAPPMPANRLARIVTSIDNIIRCGALRMVACYIKPPAHERDTWLFVPGGTQRGTHGTAYRFGDRFGIAPASTRHRLESFHCRIVGDFLDPPA